jgi:hypothetical protein
MPGQGSITRFLSSRGAPSRLAAGAVETAGPVLHAAAGHRPKAAALRPVPDAQIAAAIASATGRDVTAISRITVLGLGDERGAAYGDAVPFEGSLHLRLLERHFEGIRARVIASRGRDEWPRFKDGLWDALRHQVAYPLGLRFWDDPDDGPRSSVGESMMTSLFYLFAAAATDDADGAANLTPLVSLFPAVVPIGEITSSPGTWLVVDVPQRQ